MNNLLRILSYTLPAGRVMGIPLRVNWLILLFLPFIIAPFMQSGLSGGLGLARAILFIVILYGSILLHELGHAWGVRLVGSQIDEIQLTPLGGIAMGGTQDVSPRTELLIIGLGPAVSVLLALVGWILRLLLNTLWPSAPWLVHVGVGTLFTINTMLALFNLLVPIFPLDSAKLVRAGLSLYFNPQKVTYHLARVGIGLSAIGILASFAGVSLPLIGRGSMLLTLILIMGLQVCLYTLRSLEYNNVYSGYDNWSTRPIYYDQEVMQRVRRNLYSDLRWKPRAARRWEGPVRPRMSHIEPRKKKEKEPTKVLMAAPDPEKLTDPEQIQELMRLAADTEDFALAARLKRRLHELTGKP